MNRKKEKKKEEEEGRGKGRKQEAQLFAGIWPTVLPIADDLCKCCWRIHLAMLIYRDKWVKVKIRISVRV